MSRHLYRASAALVVAAMLSGCGAQAISHATTAPMKRGVQAFAADAIDVDKLIADFKAIEGFEADQMAKRAELVSKLGDSDDDRAMAFLQAEYENLASYPEAVRPTFEIKLVEAIDALDTYEPSLDEPIIAAGPGVTAMSEAAYLDALARKKRKKGLGHWLTAPFRWVGNGLRWLVGAKPKKKPKKRRKPKPQPDPGYPADPSYPAGY